MCCGARCDHRWPGSRGGSSAYDFLNTFELTFAFHSLAASSLRAYNCISFSGCKLSRVFFICCIRWPDVSPHEPDSASIASEKGVM